MSIGAGCWGGVVSGEFMATLFLVGLGEDKVGGDELSMGAVVALS